MKKYLAILFLLLPALTFAQTAAELDALLETQTVTIARTARFVFEAAELLPAGFSGTAAEIAAYELALSNGWLTKAANETATLQDTAFLIMNAFEFEGGIMYSLFGSPRYAYRELIYRRIIQGRSYASMTVSGTRLLQIIGSCLNYTGENEELDRVLLGGSN